MDKERKAADDRCNVNVGETVPRECAPTLKDDPVDTEEGGVEEYAAYGVAVLGGTGGKVAGLTSAKGSTVEDDGQGRVYGEWRSGRQK